MRRSVLFAVLLAACALFLLPQASTALIAGHQCSYCHDMHGAAGYTSLLNDPLIETLCLTCHGPTGISVLKADIHTNATPRSNYPAFRITCRGCHVSHSNVVNRTTGTNIKLVGAQLLTVNSGTWDVVFESRGTGAGEPTLHSFADSNEDGNGYSGICEVCHTLTGHHRNNTPDTSHHTGDTCTRCHPHTNGFMK